MKTPGVNRNLLHSRGLYLSLSLLVVTALAISLMTASILASDWTTKGNIKSKIEPSNVFDYILGNLRLFAVVTPSEVEPGDWVDFDSREYMNCGQCDLTVYQNEIEGYTIKVFNPNGNMVEEQWFINEQDKPWTLECGYYGNIYYSYHIPEDAMPGTWRIELEIAVHSIYPYEPDCIVAQDVGYFTVSGCENKDQVIKYCADENTLIYKPLGTCEIQSINCGDTYGIGWKCDPLKAECVLVEECGDGICDEFENPYNCYEDCGKCGDNLCTGPETIENCPEDCGMCGDGICDPGEELYCGADCAVCGDGQCFWYEQQGEAFYCEADCGGSDEKTCIAICNSGCDDLVPGVKDPICLIECKIKCWWQEHAILITAFGALILVILFLSVIVILK